MTRIPRSHPRYHSLTTRERITKAYEDGLVHGTGLIAHGRGEAFDYLLGERTHPFAERAAEAAAAHLVTADHPVVSVNGNVAALAARAVAQLADAVDARVEVNLFHRTDQRVARLIATMEAAGAHGVLGANPDAKIPGLESDRAACSKQGIYAADVVLVPLEDGDRCEALKKMGKTVLTVDLNPLSRTARTADVTVVDELTRAVPNIRARVDALDKAGGGAAADAIAAWDNREALRQALDAIVHGAVLE